MTTDVKKKPRIELTCKFCSEKFYLLQCQIGRGRGKFCSKECANAAMGKKISKTCTHCNKYFLKHRSEDERTFYDFCSRDCYFAHREANIKFDVYKKNGSVHVHREIVEKHIGRKLFQTEIVHHIDMNRHNNSLENLALLPGRDLHAKIHFGRIKCEEKYMVKNMEAAK